MPESRNSLCSASFSDSDFTSGPLYACPTLSDESYTKFTSRVRCISSITCLMVTGPCAQPAIGSSIHNIIRSFLILITNNEFANS